MVLAFCSGGELRRQDWAGFARGYNGAQYAKHGYDTKLAAAFATWSKIKDTPWSPGMGDPAPDPLAPTTAAPPSPAPQPAPTGGLLRSGVQAMGGAVRSGLSGLYDLIHTTFRKAWPRHAVPSSRGLASACAAAGARPLASASICSQA